LNPGSTLTPVPACKEDFSRMKLTSFDKLIERTCSLITNVRLHCDADLRPSGGVGTSGMAPDAVYDCYLIGHECVYFHYVAVTARVYGAVRYSLKAQTGCLVKGETQGQLIGLKSSRLKI
jgi:hypothetical protein